MCTEIKVALLTNVLHWALLSSVQELHDDQGRPYYYNPATGVTQVGPPAAAF